MLLSTCEIGPGIVNLTLAITSASNACSPFKDNADTDLDLKPNTHSRVSYLSWGYIL